MDDIRVELRIYGETLVFVMQRDGATLLEGSRAAGLTLPASCESGSCATCRAKLLAGHVSLRANFVLDDDELAAGYVLACQAVPESAVLALDFDV